MQAEKKQTGDRAGARPGCPMCGGALVPRGGMVRCGRCLWAMCACCETVPTEGEGESESGREPSLIARR